MNIFLDIHYEDTVQESRTAAAPACPIFRGKTAQNSAKSQKKGHQPKRRYLKENQYNWNETENRRYINFLIKQGHLLRLPTEQKKKMRVNVLMSRHVQSRNSTQCHTHHQKMMEKYGSIEAIIAEFAYLVRDSKKPEQKLVQEEPLPLPEKLKVECNFALPEPELEIERSFFWTEHLMPEIVEEEEFPSLDYMSFF